MTLRSAPAANVIRLQKAARPRSAGAALLYVTVVLVALVAVCSLAVDFGRVQVVRTELQIAADAAARYGAAALPQGVDVARRRAADAAADNFADGTPVVLVQSDDADVEFGIWNETSRAFAKLTGAERANANAVRVTTRRTASRGNDVRLFLAAMVGLGSIDVQASSVAMYDPSVAAGFVGLEKIDFGNNVEVASYDSGAGPPGGGNANDAAAIGSNGDVNMGNGSVIAGNLALGPSGALRTGRVTGQVNRYPLDLRFAPIKPGGAASANTNGNIRRTKNGRSPLSGMDFLIDNQDSISIESGRYFFTKLELNNNATVEFTGAATVDIAGPVKLGNGSKLLAPGLRPGELRLRIHGGHPIDLANNIRVVAHLHAAESPLTAGNNAELWGVVIARELVAGNNVRLWQDESAAAATGSAVITVK